MTYTGDLPINAHQATTFSGRISSIAARVGMRRLTPANDLTFTGETHSGSAGGVRLGRPSSRDRSTSPARRCSPRGGRHLRVLGLGARRPRRPVRPDLQATWIDSQNVTNDDGIVPFCIVAGCFGAPVGVTPPPITPSRS